jgi:CRISP-associated protein Cas1
MPTLYVTTPGARVEKEYRRLIVTKDDELLFRIPLFRVDQVVLVGSVGVTTPAMQALLRQGTGLAVISSSGKLLGRLVPPTLKNIALRQLQYLRGRDMKFCLEVSRQFIYGKLRNAAAMTARMRRTHPEVDPQISSKLRQAIKSLDKADDLAALRGMEGRAARLYFLAYRQSLHTDWQFGPRSHHPPKDEVNALLGLAYTLLHENLITALEVVGLDPYEGYLHADKYGRPALALDLMEEFRHLIADSVVLNLVNRRILSPQDFVEAANSIRLKPHALKKFFIAYQRRIQTEVWHPVYLKRLTYQKCFEVQARLLRKVIEGKELIYQPFITR